MAHRIEGAVVWGEIDNTTEGSTTGRLWLLGRDAPVRLELEGDCWRDLAGTRLTFRNPRPHETAGIASLQRGLVGDMTASRKSRIPLCGPGECLERQARGEEIPAVWKNLLSLEWFSESDGRVVIESTDFDLHLSERTWSMDEDAEEAQKLANLQAMRDFLSALTAGDPAAGGADEERMTEAYQEILGKYADEPDAERKQAFVMGWDRLLGSMAEAYEHQIRQDGPRGLPHEGGAEGSGPLRREVWSVLCRDVERLQQQLAAQHGGRPAISALVGTVGGCLREALEGVPSTARGDLQEALQRSIDLLGEAMCALDAGSGNLRPGSPQGPADPLRRELTGLVERMLDLQGSLKGP